jgi:hypothetical protein
VSLPTSELLNCEIDLDVIVELKRLSCLEYNLPILLRGTMVFDEVKLSKLPDQVRRLVDMQVIEYVFNHVAICTLRAIIYRIFPRLKL